MRKVLEDFQPLWRSQAAVEAGDAEGVLKGAKAGDVLKRCITMSGYHPIPIQ